MMQHCLNSYTYTDPWPFTHTHRHTYTRRINITICTLPVAIPSKRANTLIGFLFSAGIGDMNSGGSYTYRQPYTLH